MKKNTIIGAIIVGLIAAYGATKLQKPTAKNAGITIGILQTASHPALDATREGFVAELKKLLNDDVAFILYNAEGSPANAHMLAQRLHNDASIAGIYAIASLALQSAAAIEKDKPIIFATVTDPKVLGVQDAHNICGVSDMIDMRKEIEMLTQLIPQAKTVAILFNNAEANSLAQVQQIKQELIAAGLTPLEVGITQESDIPAATTMACRKADALIVPADNTLACAMELVASLALEYKKPLCACYNQAVYQGAVAARGFDYIKLGAQAAHIAYQVIQQKENPAVIGTVQPDSDIICINKKTLDALGLHIPESLSQQNITIIE